ncbi:unnamed protein product [Allacma fusca]|uniref:Serpin domain-containing protein n=1 Tax=Allacma fusca TaxID=39272 RepID=A0A8J2LS80_9HEXA|nr:unnamed protein product [Allacma fusca]
MNDWVSDMIDSHLQPRTVGLAFLFCRGKMKKIILFCVLVLTILSDCQARLRSEEAKRTKPDTQFIDKVHELGYELAKETVIHDHQVVWSPFSVVNILPLINGDESLKDSFNSSLERLASIDGLYLDRVSVALTNRSGVNGPDYNTKVLPLPSDPQILNQVIQDSFRNEAVSFRHDLPQRNQIEAEGPAPAAPPGVLDNATDIYLTSLLVAADWETPFHYGNSRLARFYINSTHAIKTKYMANVGYYKYAELDELNATVVALPLKQAPTAHFIIVIPDSRDGLEDLSNALGQRNVSDLLGELDPKRIVLRLPVISIDNQLIFNKGDRKIIQRGHIQLNHQGFHNPADRLAPQRIKFKQLKRRDGINVRVEHPFIFMIYEKFSGILAYGEVMIPAEGPPKPQLKYQQDYLSQNGKIMSESIDKLGDELYTTLRKRNSDSFAFSPFSLTNLVGSVLPGATEETKMGILSKLNFPLMWQDALVELNREGKINGSFSRISVVVNGEPNESFRKEVEKFGTTVINRQGRDYTSNYTVKSILGASDYQINPQFNKDFKKINGLFYRNERDVDNVTYIEFLATEFKYLFVPFWDAKIMSIPINDGRNQSLLLVVPGERSGLNLIEDGIIDYPVSKLLCQGHVKAATVRLRIPLLNLEHINEFSEDFSELGMPQFRDGDFSGIIANGKLDQVVQRTFFSLEQSVVNEVAVPGKNSTAEASEPPTSEVPSSKRTTRRYRGPGNPNRNGPRRNRTAKLVKVDRPFVFYVQDSRIGTVLVGRYTGLTGRPALGK